jgi:hypothetical protein
MVRVAQSSHSIRKKRWVATALVILAVFFVANSLVDVKIEENLLGCLAIAAYLLLVIGCAIFVWSSE